MATSQQAFDAKRDRARRQDASRAREQELKQQLKLYDMNFHAQHRGMPEKWEKEQIRHLYGRELQCVQESDKCHREGRGPAGAWNCRLLGHIRLAHHESCNAWECFFRRRGGGVSCSKTRRCDIPRRQWPASPGAVVVGGHGQFGGELFTGGH
jgi:hypothetical protein